MMFSSPNFVDPDFIGRDRETAFSELNESLRRIQKKLGDENFAKLMEMSNRMRVHFEADPNNDNDETIKGRNIILDMEDILKSCMKRRS
ncbi:MAG: hypothetical protein CFE28_07725 [Alphaproteobacteria bacterium PA2]|nr:MAG: hypothetical protein CFE28_07725 [Alphaproteobacteria bacterium PA2]